MKRLEQCPKCKSTSIYREGTRLVHTLEVLENKVVEHAVIDEEYEFVGSVECGCNNCDHEWDVFVEFQP